MVLSRKKPHTKMSVVRLGGAVSILSTGFNFFPSFIYVQLTYKQHWLSHYSLKLFWQ